MHHPAPVFPETGQIYPAPGDFFSLARAVVTAPQVPISNLISKADSALFGWYFGTKHQTVRHRWVETCPSGALVSALDLLLPGAIPGDD